MSFFDPQNPGIGGLRELTTAEQLFLTTLAGVSWSQGSIPFIDSSGFFTQDNANFFWDDTNNRLGIGTSSPAKPLDVRGGTVLWGADNTGSFALEVKNLAGTSLFSFRGYGDGLMGATTYWGSYNSNNFMSAGAQGISSNQATGNNFVNWRHNNGTYALEVQSNKHIILQRTGTGSVGIANTSPFTGASVTGGLELGNFNGTNADGNLIIRGYAALGGISKSAYGAVGSNYYLSSANSLLRKNADSVSLIDFSNGSFIFKNAGSGAANSSISLSTLATLSALGNWTSTCTLTSAAGTGVGNDFTTNHTVNTSASYIGTRFISNVSTASGAGGITVAQQSTLTYSATSNHISGITGYQVDLNHTGSGTLPSVSGMISQGYVGNSAGVSNYYAFKTLGLFTPATGTVSTQYGYYYDQAYITPTTGYAFYSKVNPNGGTLASATDISINPTSTNGVIVGTGTPDASARLQVDSTTKGFAPPRMTSTQRDAISSPMKGLIIYNTTTDKHQGYNGAWVDFY